MFNDDYEDETLSTEENNDSGKNFKLILIIAGVFIGFIVILLLVNSMSKPKTSPQPTPSAPVVIQDDEDYESGEEEEEEVPEEQRVGNSSYGYITIPGDWQEYQDAASNSSLQFTDGSYIVTLKAVESASSSALSYATAVKQNFVKDGVDTTGATVSLGMYVGYLKQKMVKHISFL